MERAASASRAIVLTEVEQLEGAERSVVALSRWLQERGLEHHFVVYEDRAGLAARAGHPVEVVQLLPGDGARRRALALRAYFAKAQGAWRPLVSGYQAALHATLGGVRGFHCLMHDTPTLFEEAGPTGVYAHGYRWASNRVVRLGLRSGGQTMVTSEFLQRDCRRLFGVDAAIARMGGYSGTPPQRGPKTSAGMRMLSLSRIEGNKRIDWVLRALAAMERGAAPLSARTDWRLDVAGRGAELEAMTSLAKELGLSGRVRFHGYVSDAELERLYGEADLFLMPAVQGYGIPAIEALGRGLHVLVHRESGVSDLLLTTPWVTVMNGGEEAMLDAMNRAVETTLLGEFRALPQPPLPTEDSWAEQVATLCGWV